MKPGLPFLPAIAVLLAILALAGTTRAATTVGNIIEEMPVEHAEKSSVQQAIAQMLAASATNANDFVAVVVTSSNGSFVPAVIDAIRNAGDYDTASRANLQSILTSTADDAAAAERIIANINAVNGVVSLSGATIGSVSVAAVGGTGGVVQTRQQAVLAERRTLSEKFGSSAALAAAMNMNSANRLWLAPFHTRQSAEKNGADEGFSYAATGVSVGYDRAFGAVVAGAAFTYSKGDYDVSGAVDDNAIANYGLSAYAQYLHPPNGIYVSVSAGFNRANNNWNRYLGNQANGSGGWKRDTNRTDSHWFGANAGKDYAFGHGGAAVTFTPSIGFFWSGVTSSSYVSRDQVDIVYGKSSQSSFVVPFELEARKTYDLGDQTEITLKGQLGYSYNFDPQPVRGSMRYNYTGSRIIDVIGSTPDRYSLSIGMGGKIQHKAVDLSVDYRYTHRQNSANHHLSATFGLNF